MQAAIKICDLQFSLKFQGYYILEIVTGKNVQSNYDDAKGYWPLQTRKLISVE